MKDVHERRALLLHLGDAIEAIACVSKCGQHCNTVGESATQEESLMSFAILSEVDSEMTPLEFIKKASNAFFLWPKELLAETLNYQLLAHLVQHDLFAGDQAGWDRYVSANAGMFHGSVAAWSRSRTRRGTELWDVAACAE